MSGLPWWKLRREIARIGRKTAQLPGEIARRVYFRRWYDLVTARSIRRTQGGMPLGKEVGIYLIFPSKGILPSHLRMLEEMRVQDVSPVVISNLALSDADRARLSPLVARLIERANVGYDFGGYRDGILDLADKLPHMRRLWLMNDSVWLLPQPRSWFETARALGTDFMAASSNFAMPRVDPERFTEITWKHSSKHRNFHYASYALGIGANILRDPKFLRYWRKLEIRNDKHRTVRRGEVGLTQWVLRQGYSHRATCEIDQLDAELAGCGNAEIDTIARELVFPEDKPLETIRTRVLARDPETPAGRAERISLILTATSRYASAYALPGYTLPRGFQFLKKSPLWLSAASSETMLKLIERIEGPAGDEIRREASDLALSRKPKTG